MTILEKIKFEEDWLSEVNLTKENIKIAFAGIRATALEQQPCEDCVSRQRVIDYFVDWYGYDYMNTGYYGLIKQMPSVTPQTGEWKVSYQGGIPIICICSECGHRVIYHNNKDKYCPECGARMNGGGEE